MIDVGADEPRLAAFHAGIYLDAFAHKQEPLAAWQAALRGEAPYALTVRLALDGDAIAAGICFERYPVSGVGLVTYLIVAPPYRNRGLGEQLLRSAGAELIAAGAPVVLGEVADPARDRSAEAAARLARFERWGARVLPVRYVQPALGPGLVRDPGLVLVALPPVPTVVRSASIRAFIDEIYAVTEGGAPDPDCEIPCDIAPRARS